MSDRYHIWSPGFVIFGGGIAAFSQETARALGADKALLFGKHDAHGATFMGQSVAGSSGWPGASGNIRFALRLALAACTERPALILSNHLNFGSVAFGLKKLFHLRYALVAHGFEVGSTLSNVRLAAIRAADAVFAVSRWTRNRVLALGGVDPERVHLLPNTVDDTRFTPGPRSNDLAMRYGLAPGERVLLTVARLSASEGYKGCDLLLKSLPELIAACGPLRYLIVGSGDDRRRIEQLAQKLGVSKLVTFCGFIPDHELADHFRLADVFAMPSLGEGFGIVFLEAMACGCPVLAGNRDGSVDALADGELGLLVDPHNHSEVTAGLISLFRRTGPSLWFEPHRLRDTMLKRYGRQVFKQRLNVLLEELAKRN